MHLALFEEVGIQIPWFFIMTVIHIDNHTALLTDLSSEKTLQMVLHT